MNGYRGPWKLRPGADDLHDAALRIEGAETLHPGASGVIRLYPLFSGYWQRLSPGARIELFEGARLVGEAEVLENWTRDPV